MPNPSTENHISEKGRKGPKIFSLPTLSFHQKCSVRICKTARISVLLGINSDYGTCAPFCSARLLASPHLSTQRTIRLYYLMSDNQLIQKVLRYWLLAVRRSPESQASRTFVPDSKQQLRAGLCPIPNLVTTRDNLHPQLSASRFAWPCSCLVAAQVILPTFYL